MDCSFIKNNQYNIGYICSRLHCESGNGEKVAMRWVSPSLECRAISFQELEDESNKFANSLLGLGVRPGEIVFTFLPKMPEQFIVFLGILKIQAIAGMLFANFGEDALLDRLGDAGAKMVITKKSLLKKIIRIRSGLPALKYIILVDADQDVSPDIRSYQLLMRESLDFFTTPLTAPDTPSVLHYTSGSTGKPKGVLHIHRSVLLQYQTSQEILRLGGDDIFWCTADQGWITGTSYGIIGPWSLGVTQIHFGGSFDAEAWCSILEREQVSIWYTAPTALRMLMREDFAFYEKFNLSRLKYIFSVGEPLNPEILRWSRKVLGKDIYDTWFQTETGSIMIANRPDLPIKPGAMGKPVNGVAAVILSDDGTPQAYKEQGNLCLRPGWSSMFVTYLNNEQVYHQKFRHGCYYSGDTAYQDEDGYFWFMGRSDDIINTAGHLVSPFEVESALLEIEEIAESGVIGAPDDLLFEKVVAFVHVQKNVVFTPELELKIRLYVANRVSSIATPQEIRVVKSIPKNKSGKIMRRILKAWYLGKDTGDISTLETEL